MLTLESRKHTAGKLMTLLRLRHYLAAAALAALFAALACAQVYAPDSLADQPASMTLLQAAILGVVEGLTEYLPVSSTGHLILTQHLLGIPADTAAGAFAITIQAGAIVAVLALYTARVRQMASGLIGRNPLGLRLATNIAWAFLPAAVVGLAAQDLIKAYLFGGEAWGMWPIVAAWFLGGVAILAVAFYRKSRRQPPHAGLQLDQLTWQLAILIGVFQCAALWPGVSRSLVTIVGGVIVGLSLPAAVEFSFLLGVATLGAATLYDALKHGDEMLAAYGLAPLLVGFIAATLSAALAVSWMVAYLRSHGLSLFGYYRIALALLVALAILTGFID
jgi:undecaprenyl-diphosphatase